MRNRFRIRFELAVTSPMLSGAAMGSRCATPGVCLPAVRPPQRDRYPV